MTEVAPRQLEQDIRTTTIARAILRPLLLEDDTAVHELIRPNPEPYHAAGEPVAAAGLSVEAARTWIEQAVRLSRAGRAYAMCPENRFVGAIGYVSLDGIYADIWYWVGVEHMRQGHATTAVEEIVDIMYSSGVMKINAWVGAENKASQGTLRKTGFVCLSNQQPEWLFRHRR